jgi:hypothetical protein
MEHPLLKKLAAGVEASPYYLRKASVERGDDEVV